MVRIKLQRAARPLQPHSKSRRAGQGLATQDLCGGGGAGGAHLQPRGGSAGGWCAGLQQQARRATGTRREGEAARGSEITGAHVPQFAHYCGQRPAFQRLLHRPQSLLALRRLHDKQPRRIKPEGGKTGPIERTAFQTGKILANPHQRTAPGAGKAQRQHQRKAGSRRPVRRASRDNLMQRAARKATAQRHVKLGCLRPQHHAAARPVLQHCPARLDPGDGAAQLRQMHSVFRPAAVRHQCNPFSISSIFVLIDSGVRAQSQAAIGEVKIWIPVLV